MRKLEDFNLADNAIASIDEATFYDVPNLKSLLLFKNQIRILPSKLLRNSWKLVTFDVQRNMIESIAQNFFLKNTQLEHVNFSNNLLTTIWFDFTELSKLRNLFLTPNQCTRSLNVNLKDIQMIQYVINANCQPKK